MRDDDPNLRILRTIAIALGSLRAQVVFVGGSTAGLLLSDPAAESIRPTFDVDGVIAADTLAQFYAFEARLVERGFVRVEDVVCRWRHRDSGVLLDLMPTNPNVLGFSNRWYPQAVATSTELEIQENVWIRVVSAPGFIATKFDAFLGRGHGDLMGSHDIEDILNVVDGRPELIEEVESTSESLRLAVLTALTALMAHKDFDNCLPGLLSDSARAGIVRERMQRILRTGQVA